MAGSSCFSRSWGVSKKSLNSLRYSLASPARYQTETFPPSLQQRTRTCMAIQKRPIFPLRLSLINKQINKETICLQAFLIQGPLLLPFRKIAKSETVWAMSIIIQNSLSWLRPAPQADIRAGIAGILRQIPPCVFRCNSKLGLSQILCSSPP